MAYWFKKRGKVYVCYQKDGRPVPLARSLTLHLDGESEANLDAFADHIARTYEGAKRTSRPPNLLLQGSDLGELLNRYIAYLESRKRRKNTIGWHRSMLEQYVIPFFLEGDKPLADPGAWPGKSIHMHAALVKDGLSASNIKRANIALRGFYNFLCEEGRILTGQAIRLRSPLDPAKSTPLQVILTPTDVLQWARAQSNTEIRLMALLGYFFSLRPQELFELKPSDLWLGAPVEGLECAKVMLRAGLFNRMAVHVTRQDTPDGQQMPKAHSKGWVCCFDRDAAKMIQAALADRPPQDHIFEVGARHLFRRWGNQSIKNVTLKDLRRASLYWLGHHTPLEATNVQKHARHKRLETTMQYLRRPEEEIGAWVPLSKVDL